MKKILIATTALVATAGVASADITLSGMGRIGVVVNETAGTAAVAFEQGTISATATTGNIARVTALNGGNALTNFATAAGNTSAADITALNGLITSLATDLATAQAAQAAAVTATGAAAASGTGSAAATASAAANLAEAQAILAEISGTAAVAAVAKKTSTTVDTRVQFDIAGSASADNGLSFGGKIRMRSTSGSTTLNGGQIMMAYGDMTVYGGNIPGPLESMPHAYSNTVGYTGGTFQATVNQADTMAFSSTGSGANAIQVNYSMGAVSVAAAHQPSTDNNQATITYSANGLTVALGGQFSNRAAEDETIASIGYAMGNFSFNASTSDNNGTSKTSFGASVNAGNGLTMKAYVTEKEKEANNAYGLGLSYDLGGATFGLGYETRHDKSDYINAGISFSF